MSYRRGVALGLGVLLILTGAVWAQPKNSAAEPAPRDDNWKKRHEDFVAIAKNGNVDVLFIGDSITDSWRSAGKRDGRDIGGKNVWDKEFKDWKIANFGIGGDRTQHVLWRLQNGALKGITPKVVMLMIGTNNSNGSDNTAEEIADGIKAVIAEIQKQSPQTKVLLLGIFPRQERADHPQREKLKKINAIIAKLDDKGKTVTYLDIGDKFLEKDGSISKDVMYDYLHLTDKAYQTWADAVKPTLQEMMK